LFPKIIKYFFSVLYYLDLNLFSEFNSTWSNIYQYFIKNCANSAPKYP